MTQVTLKDAKKKCEEQGMVVSSLDNPPEYKSVSEYLNYIGYFVKIAE
jgi:hypothetical protein